MAVPDAHLLLAMGWADARIDVEHDASWRTAADLSYQAADLSSTPTWRAETAYAARPVD